MTRRTVGVIVTLLSGLLVGPLAAEAQPAGKVWRIGFLEPGSASVNRHFLDAFRQGLRDLGYVEGQTITIEDRWADGRPERFPDLVAELIGLRVDDIVTAAAGAPAAKRATTTIPIIFLVTDPVASGLVASLARPGGNLTGVSLGWDPGFVGKWVGLLREVVPSASRMALLWSRGATVGTYFKDTQDAAKALRVTLEAFEVRDSTELDGAFVAMTRKRIEGLIVAPTAMTVRHRTRIVDLAAKHRLPAIYGFGEFARAGGLMAYGSSIPDVYRRLATYVDKILKGRKPADLPVEQPTKFELVINTTTAKALGLAFPQSILLQATEAVE